MFVVGGFFLVSSFEQTQAMVAQGLTPWGLASIALIATVLAIILKLGGGLLLMFNYKTSYAAWMLIVFTVLATLMFHTNWSGENGQMQLGSFLKNLAIIGGLLLYAKCFCKKCNGAPAPASTTPATPTV
jgi:putative oxidoreductase